VGLFYNIPEPTQGISQADSTERTPHHNWHRSVIRPNDEAWTQMKVINIHLAGGKHAAQERERERVDF